MVKYRVFASLVLAVLLLIGCGENTSTIDNTHLDYSKTLFQLVSNQHSNIDFSNEIEDGPVYNYLTYEGFYQGAGVGVGDFNNDGLQDVFFSGNQATDRLYLNKGDFKFEDITSSSGIIQDSTWSTGVAVVDINNDGFLDIYVCKFFYEENIKRKNYLYVNKGDMTFVEAADKFGLDDMGYAIQSNFFDYDKDGDLDVYIVNQPPTKNSIRYGIGSSVDYKYSDRLYRNDGDYGFVDVTEKAGLQNFGYGLNVLASDLTNDGWVDLYVSNDFEEADFYYENMKDGTFREVRKDNLGHMSTYSMGSDAADINNDGLIDFMVADMVSSDPFRQKTNMASMDVGKFNRLTDRFGVPQYMYNALQMNQGHGHFTEQGQLRGVAYSDWSWSVLMFDMDNDMDKDILITNGIKNDVTNKDVQRQREELGRVYQESKNKLNKKGINSENELILDKMPSLKLVNPIYENNGSGKFIKANESIGLLERTWTHGAAYADLDGDGDLDLIMNNSSGKASVYKNTSEANYLRFRLSSINNKQCPIGTKVFAYNEGRPQLQELNPIRGYQSTCECVAHFGMGEYAIADSVVIVWNDGSKRKLGKLPVNKTYDIRKGNSKSLFEYPKKKEELKFLSGIKRKENFFDDYRKQRLLPYKLSTLGPMIDVDEIENTVFVPGAVGSPSQLFAIRNDKLIEIEQGDLAKLSQPEDVAGVFADIDNDGDNDLLVVTGGIEYNLTNGLTADRLYINDNGNYRIDNTFPLVNQSGLAVEALDVNGDDLIDFFVGGRVVPDQYGVAPSSFFYINRRGTFDIIELTSLGMVTDVEIADLDNDSINEIVISEEWGKVKIFHFEQEKLKDISTRFKLESPSGLWRSVSIDDYNNDGLLDIIAGNIGMNSKYQITENDKIYLSHGDFDDNGSYDLYISYDYNGKVLPVRGLQCSSEQMPGLKKDFKDYNSFALVTTDDIIGNNNNRNDLVCQSTKNTLFLNGDSGFKKSELPLDFQVSCLNDIVKSNNENSWIAGGNYLNMEAETPRLDQMSLLKFVSTNGKFSVAKNTYPQVVLDTRSLKSISGKLILSTNKSIHLLDF